MILPHVSRGQPFDRRASTHNAFVDAANDYISRTTRFTPPVQNTRSYPHAITLKVKNVSGSTVDFGGILTLPIDSTVISFATVANDYIFGETILEGDTPTGDPTAPIAILLEPALDDQIVDAVILGVATCYVDIDESTHRYALAQSGSRFALRSCQYGQCRILDRENDGATGNTQYCKVFLNYASPLRAKAVVDNGSPITANGSGLVTLVSGTTEETGSNQVTAHYNWMTSGATEIDNGTEVIIEYFPSESKWIIVQADCP